jgi:ring-1,2-phenylacetyl-CoA epoxidase subunit PaaD
VVIMPAPAPGLDPNLMAVLSQVLDPEIPAVSVVDLGIVRRAGPEGVAITPTYTGCPASRVIERSIRDALDEAGFTTVPLTTELDPPWSTDWISDEGRAKLLAYGIAPPPKGEGRGSVKDAAPVVCPRCRSSHTEELSRFGSTPCKSLWRCLDCAEPFDQFKCL